MTAEGGALAGSRGQCRRHWQRIWPLASYRDVQRRFAVASSASGVHRHARDDDFHQRLAVRFTRSQSIHNLPSGFTGIGRMAWPGVSFLRSNGSVCRDRPPVADPEPFRPQALRARHESANRSRKPGSCRPDPILAYAACGTCAGRRLHPLHSQAGKPDPGSRAADTPRRRRAAVIGGDQPLRRRGQVPTTLLGVLFICLIDNSLNMNGLSNFAVMMVKGA